MNHEGVDRHKSMSIKLYLFKVSSVRVLDLEYDYYTKFSTSTSCKVKTMSP